MLLPLSWASVADTRPTVDDGRTIDEDFTRSPTPGATHVTHIDTTAIFAIWMGTTILLVPLMALAIRYAVLPLIAALTALRAAGQVEYGESVSERLARVEQRLGEVEVAVTVHPAGTGSSLPYD
jgi:hypothetical protein